MKKNIEQIQFNRQSKIQRNKGTKKETNYAMQALEEAMNQLFKNKTHLARNLAKTRLMCS